MDEFVKINENWLLSDDHMVLTKRGWFKAKDLKIDDEITGVLGVSTISSILKCGTRPQAPIIGYNNNDESPIE